MTRRHAQSLPVMALIRPNHYYYMNYKTLLTKPILALAAIAALGGGAGVAAIASADTATTSTSGTSGAAVTQTPTNTQAPQRDPHMGGHTANGITETLLTGDTAAKATAAALAAVPGGTIERVETDAEGAVYEAHMTKADGSHVTVKLDANFNVTGTEAGPTMPPRGIQQ